MEEQFARGVTNRGQRFFFFFGSILFAVSGVAACPFVPRLHGRAPLSGRRWLFRFAVPEQLVVVVRKPVPFFVCCATSWGPRNHRCVFYDFPRFFDGRRLTTSRSDDTNVPGSSQAAISYACPLARCCLNANHRV